MTALRAAADAAWAEAGSLRQELLRAIELDDVSDACRAHTDDACAAFRRAQERAVAIEQLAEHSEGT